MGLHFVGGTKIEVFRVDKSRIKSLLYQKRGYNSCVSNPVVRLYLRPNTV
jgi:hypothetical protein